MDAQIAGQRRYRCNKEVYAVKIKQVTIRPAEGHILTPEDSNRGEIIISDAFYQHHKPVAGGYLVIYDDGYQSFSPAKAFEEGYTLITEADKLSKVRPLVPKRISVGRTVLYVLSEDDAKHINRRRTTGAMIAQLISDEKWFIGVQAHIGNTVDAGRIFPAVAVAVLPVLDITNLNPPVNFQVLLNGNDTYWATSRHEDIHNAPGSWHWPERV